MTTPVIVYPSARLEIPTALKTVGYTEAESQAIYHQHVAQMERSEQARFLSMVYSGLLSYHTRVGKHLLITSRGH